MKRKDNLYGKLPVGEGPLLCQGIAQAALHYKEELMNPKDLEHGAQFDPDNLMFCLCDIAVVLQGLAYGGVPQGGEMWRLWMFKTEELFRDGMMKNKDYGCHYDYVNQKTGELDFTRVQFPVEYFLYRYAKKKNFEVKNGQLGRRMKLLVPEVIDVGRALLPSVESPTEDLIRFLDQKEVAHPDYLTINYPVAKV